MNKRFILEMLKATANMALTRTGLFIYESHFEIPRSAPGTAPGGEAPSAVDAKQPKKKFKFRLFGAYVKNADGESEWIPGIDVLTQSAQPNEMPRFVEHMPLIFYSLMM